MDRKLARVRELQIHIYAFRNGVVDMLRVLYLGNFTTILLVVVTSLMQSGIPAIIIIILTMVQSYADDTHYPPPSGYYAYYLGYWFPFWSNGVPIAAPLLPG
jgi:hypothetical protein